jgi:hypothetical protein
MPATWVPDSVLLADVGRFVGLDDPAGLAARWGAICTRANAQAQAELTGILAGKGYSAAQVAEWDWRREYALQLGVYLAICLGQADRAEEAKVLDRRAELREAVVLMIGGAPVAPPSPAETDVGGIASGTLSARDDILREGRDRGLFR